MHYPKSYSLAVQVDLTLKLNLNNDQFERLATFLDGYQDPQRVANSFMQGTPGDVLTVIADFKKRATSENK